ncbi:MAG: hypothetical protein DWQ10_13935 [Calditrichaeota bacterium]|nr:MAG: hypothetical protein DWQ10_13935 [Calditrichota bacterium]
MEINWIQLFGYFGSVLIAVSLMMRSIVRLRWINLCGAAVFSIYGLLVHAIPVFLLNGFIVLIDIYYLAQMVGQKNYFEILEKNRLSAPYLQRFFKYYEKDLHKFFPDFNPDTIHNPIVFIILRNMMPIGVFIGEPIGEHTLEIKLDYVIPDYRDLKSAYFLFGEKQRFFADNQITKLTICSRVEKHLTYLKKTGFEKDEKRGENCYILRLTAVA